MATTMPYQAAPMDNQSHSTDVCSKHGPSTTPILDKQLREPRTRAMLQSFGSNFGEASDCTQCGMERVAITLATYFQSYDQAKKNGDISKREAREMKREMKLVYKKMEREMKAFIKK